MSPGQVLQGRGCAAGEFEGEAVVSSQPFGFWQGMDPLTGIVIAATGIYRLKLLMATKNGSSSSYFGRLNHAQLQQTA